MSTAIHHWSLVAAVVACAAGAIVDLRTGHIPHWISLSLFGAGPVVRMAVALHHHHAWPAAARAGLFSIAAGVGSALIPLYLARKGGLGLGDVKLFAGIGAACGVFVALYAQTYAYVFAMAHALVVVLRRKKVQSTFGNIARLLGRARSPAEDGDHGHTRHESFTEMKFGPAILAGMCVAAWAQWSS